MYIAYKNGKNIGMIMGLDIYDVVEEYLVEIDFIEKKEIKESIDITQFKNKTKNEKYLLLIVGKEEQRTELTKLMEKYFSNYKYDVINLKSDVGKEIKDYIQNNNKFSNEYPQMFYYQDDKLIKYGHVYDEETFDQFKKELDILDNITINNAR